MAFSSCSLSGSDGSDSDSGKRGKLQRCVSWTDDAGGALADIREIDRVKRAPPWQALLSWSVLKEEVLATFGRGLEEGGGRGRTTRAETRPTTALPRTGSALKRALSPCAAFS